MEKKNSNAFYVVKFFAIISVIFAHCSYRSTPTVQAITDLIGTIGVPIFLISAGIFFKPDEDSKSFWVKKLKGIVVPWVIFGIITYAVSVILGSPFSITGLLCWWIGYGTWLYFVTILLVYYAIFKLVRWKGLPYVMIGVWLASMVLDVIGINPLTNLVGPYLNFFSRIGYFAIGIVLKDRGVMSFQAPKLWIKLAFSVASLGTGILALVMNQLILVFVFKLLFVLVACVTLFLWSQSLSECKLLQDIGKQTYFIYFVHMQFGIGVANIIFGILPTSPIVNAVLLVVKPLTILAMVYVGIIVLLKLLSIMKLDKHKWIVGLK